MGGSPSDSSHVTNTLEVFDPSTNVWSAPTTSGTFTPRWFFGAVVVNGKIYTMGGMDQNGNALNILEVFDPATNTWSTPATSGTFTARYDLAAVSLNGIVFAIGGTASNLLNTFEAFDPVANIWSTPSTTGSFTPRSGLAATALNGTFYVMAGWVKLGKSRIIDNANYAYTPGGAAAPVISPLNFGSIDYAKDSSLNAVFHILSTTAVLIDKILITGTDSSDFIVSSNSKEVIFPYQLQQGDSIVFHIKYSAPSSTEHDTATLRIFLDKSSDTISIGLSGSSHAPSNKVSIPLESMTLNTLIYPNPAASEIRIDYSIPKRSAVVLSVFDITGKKIATIASEEHDAGSYETVWNARTLPNGSYILKLTACGESVTKVMEIVR